MLVKDVMHTDVVTVKEKALVADVLDELVNSRLHSAPVLDASENLVGMITLTDILFGGMTRPEDLDDAEVAEGVKEGLKVTEIMTSPAMSVTEDAEIRDVCRMMFSVGLHRVPVTRDEKVVGIMSSLDICGLVADDEI